MICLTQLSEVIATLEVIEVKGVNDLCNTCLNACQRIVNHLQVFPELIQPHATHISTSCPSHASA